jgi:hypothetical protein
MRPEHLLGILSACLLIVLFSIKFIFKHRYGEGFADTKEKGNPRKTTKGGGGSGKTPKGGKKSSAKASKTNKRSSGKATKTNSGPQAPSDDIAAVPKPEGSSTVPNTMPGSTTPNSSESLASFRDLAALVDIMKTYNLLYETNIKSAFRVKKYAVLHANSISYQIKIQSQIDTGAIVDTKEFATKQRKLYGDAIKELNGRLKDYGEDEDSKAKARASKAFGDGEITLRDLEYVIGRAKEEQKRIEDIRSESPDLKRRTQILERIRLDLQGFVDKIKRGEMTLGELPFKKPELRRFLIEVENPTALIRALPDLEPAEKKPVPKQKQPTSTSSETGGLNTAALLQQLRSATRDLSWEVYIGYDPKVTVQRRIMERIRVISTQIESGTLSESELASKMIELTSLKQQVNSQGLRRVAMSENPLEAYESFGQEGSSVDAEPFQPKEVPTIEPGLFPSKEGIIRTIEPPIASNDWRIRPGYTMNTEQIALRGSTASLGEVGGPDYKKRAKFLCSQIRDSGLGDPKEFGCIKNPDEDVGADYSWRGNFKMVCSRLGRTWGEWYPEMFGCPKPDPSASQAPLIRINP